MIARVDPRLPDMILASSGEEDFFVKMSRKAAFEPPRRHFDRLRTKRRRGRCLTTFYGLSLSEAAIFCLWVLSSAGW